VKYHISVPSNHKRGIEKENIKKDKNLAGGRLILLEQWKFNSII